MINKKILVVDDETTLCDTLRFNLELEGYEVDTAYSAEEALAMDLSVYALVLLDVMMGEISGWQMARIMKGNPRLAGIPIIFCTAKDSEDDMVAGLDLGADDYISKPYSIRNVVARVRSVLRRASSGASVQQAGPGDDDCLITSEGLTLNSALKRCTVDGTEVRLPRKEFEMLWLMLSHRGKIFSREEFLKKIWPEEIVVVERVVDVNITRLRSKLGQYGRMIVTRSGYGYGWQD